MLTIVQTNIARQKTFIGQERRTGGEVVDVYSGIVKTPVDDLFIDVGSLGLAGDIQVDTGTVKGKQVHGGPLKAIYAMPLGNLALWDAELGDILPGVSFGENLTVEGPDETQIYIGDEFECDGVRLRVTGARRPCFKLDLHLGRGVARRMIVTGRTGWYFAVGQAGRLPTAGAILQLVNRRADMPTVAEAFGRRMREDDTVPGLRDADS